MARTMAWTRAFVSASADLIASRTSGSTADPISQRRSEVSSRSSMFSEPSFARSSAAFLVLLGQESKDGGQDHHHASLLFLAPVRSGRSIIAKDTCS